MSGCIWIVCERGGRWAPTLRLLLEYEAANGNPRHRPREVRHLAELSTILAERPVAIAAVEVHRGNFAEALAWFASAERDFPLVRCIALCDRAIAANEYTDALREAGAWEFTSSPRQLRAILQFGQRHAAMVAEHASVAEADDTLSLTARTWASLPWQDA